MKRIATALAAIGLLFSCQDAKHGNLHLTGHVKGLGKGKLYIKKQGDSALVTLDSLIIEKDAPFETWLEVASPEVYVLQLDRGATSSMDDQLSFFAEPGEMKIETNLEAFYADARVSGSKNHELLEEFRKVNRRFTDTHAELLVEKMRAQRLGKTQRLDSLERISEHNMKRRYLYAVNFAVTHNDHEVAPYIALSEIPDVNLRYLDTIRSTMSPKVAQSLYGKKLTAFCNERKKNERP